MEAFLELLDEGDEEEDADRAGDLPGLGEGEVVPGEA